jgi:hypothetical protein
MMMSTVKLTASGIGGLFADLANKDRGALLLGNLLAILLRNLTAFFLGNILALLFGNLNQSE